MYTIKTLNAISPAGLAKLPVNQFEVDNETTAPQGILVRSADMHDMPLPDSLLAIARAGAGTNNIPVEECTERRYRGVQHPRRQRQRCGRAGASARWLLGSRNMVRRRPSGPRA